MSQWTADSRQYRRQRREFLLAYTTCWLCGLAGANTIDHVLPASLFPDLRYDPANWRPAHHRCNARRGNRMTMPRTRRSRQW